MSASSTTVGSLAVQIAAIRQNQEELRSLLRDTLGEMLRISQVQAEANATMLRILEQQSLRETTFLAAGPGTSRSRSETDEYESWRAERYRESQSDSREDSDR
jgi:hypothetical protein